ncbi:MAG: pseudouridine synthase [candidate division Zixibacteria bacterium]|nr:pseudouridine synthase [candidate division Zixibacteria bacterium]
MTEIIRLNSYISKCGICSRRQADELIAQGKIKINGERITVLGTKVDPGKDEVEFEGKLIKPIRQYHYFALNKPVGVVTTLKDPQKRKTISHYIARTGMRLFPVGRLDYDSEGLLLLTNDGELAHRLQHPRYEIEKGYVVEIHKPLDQNALNRIKEGVTLDDGFFMPKSINTVNNRGKSTTVHIVITEGRNRIIRRLFDSLGYNVVTLKRVSIDVVELGDLKAGSLRELNSSEVKTLKKRAGLK